MKHLLLSLILLALPSLASAQKQVTTTVRITYYNINGRTAYGTQTHNGIVAVSRDLERMGFKLGEKVYIEGYGTFQIQDRTSSRLTKTIDIWLPKGKRIKNGKNIKATLIYDND